MPWSDPHFSSHALIQKPSSSLFLSPSLLDNLLFRVHFLPGTWWRQRKSCGAHFLPTRPPRPPLSAPTSQSDRYTTMGLLLSSKSFAPWSPDTRNLVETDVQSLESGREHSYASVKMRRVAGGHDEEGVTKQAASSSLIVPDCWKFPTSSWSWPSDNRGGLGAWSHHLISWITKWFLWLLLLAGEWLPCLALQVKDTRDERTTRYTRICSYQTRRLNVFSVGIWCHSWVEVGWIQFD